MDEAPKYFLIFLFFSCLVCVFGFNFTSCNKKVNVTYRYPRTEEQDAMYPEGIDCVWEIFTSSEFGLKFFFLRNRPNFRSGTNRDTQFLVPVHNETEYSPSFWIFEKNPLTWNNQSVEASKRISYLSDQEANEFLTNQSHLWIVFTMSPLNQNYSLNDSYISLNSFPIFYESLPLNGCEYPDHLPNKNQTSFYLVGSEIVFSCHFLQDEGLFWTVNLTLSCIVGVHNIPMWNDSLSKCYPPRPSVRELSSLVDPEKNLDKSVEKMDMEFSGEHSIPECGFVFENDTQGNLTIDEYFPESSTCNFTIEVKNCDELELQIHNLNSDPRGTFVVFGNDQESLKDSFNLSQIKEFPQKFSFENKKVEFTFWIPENRYLRFSLMYFGKNKTVIQCKPLNPFLNGFVSTNNRFLGVEVEFFCDDHYKIIGKNSSKCEISDLGFAQWSHPTPSCLCTGTLNITKSIVINMSELVSSKKNRTHHCVWNIRKSQGEPSYNLFIKYNNISFIKPGFKLTIKDKNNIHEFKPENLTSNLTLIYEIISDNLTFEVSTEDSLNINISQIDFIFKRKRENNCSYPSLENGKFDLNQDGLELLAVFTCDQGYKLIGEKKLTCIFNNASQILKWNHQPPSCIRPQCSGQIDNGNSTSGAIVVTPTPLDNTREDLNCTWTIHLSDERFQKIIEISVRHFNLSGCLQISEVRLNSSENFLKEICDNSESLFNLTSFEREITLQYFASLNGSFSIEYNVLLPSMTKNGLILDGGQTLKATTRQLTMHPEIMHTNIQATTPATANLSTKTTIQTTLLLDATTQKPTTSSQIVSIGLKPSTQTQPNEEITTKADESEVPTLQASNSTVSAVKTTETQASTTTTKTKTSLSPSSATMSVLTQAITMKRRPTTPPLAPTSPSLSTTTTSSSSTTSVQDNATLILIPTQSTMAQTISDYKTTQTTPSHSAGTTTTSTTTTIPTTPVKQTITTQEAITEQKATQPQSSPQTTSTPLSSSPSSLPPTSKPPPSSSSSSRSSLLPLSSTPLSSSSSSPSSTTPLSSSSSPSSSPPPSPSPSPSSPTSIAPSSQPPSSLPPLSPPSSSSSPSSLPPPKPPLPSSTTLTTTKTTRPTTTTTTTTAIITTTTAAAATTTTTTTTTTSAAKPPPPPPTTPSIQKQSTSEGTSSPNKLIPSSSSSSSSSPQEKVISKYDPAKTNSSSVTVITGHKTNDTTLVKSAKNNQTKNYSSIVAGIILPLLILFIIAISVYIWYRKKYPVRMIVGKEFSNFTNPLYIKNANSVSVNADPGVRKSKPHFSLVIEKPNPIDNDGEVNLGFEKEIDPKHLGSESCEFEGENIELELKTIESFEGENKAEEEEEEEEKEEDSVISQRKNSNASKNENNVIEDVDNITRNENEVNEDISNNESRKNSETDHHDDEDHITKQNTKNMSDSIH